MNNTIASYRDALDKARQNAELAEQMLDFSGEDPDAEEANAQALLDVSMFAQLATAWATIALAARP